jgi:hypothetical protein
MNGILTFNCHRQEEQEPVTMRGKKKAEKNTTPTAREL